MPCNASAPELRAAYEKFSGTCFEILSVSMHEQNEVVEAFIDRYDLNYPFLMDRDGSIATMYQVVESPTTVFVGPDGMIVDELTGVVTRDWIEANIRRVGIV